MICPTCGEGLRVKSANVKKVAGVLMHKLCPEEKARRKVRKAAKEAKV